MVDEAKDSVTLAAELTALYALAEKQMLAGITAILRRTAATLEGRQAALPKIRTLVRQIVARLAYRSNPLVARMLTAALNEGARDAVEAVGKQVVLAPKTPGAGGAGRPPGSALTPAGGDDYFDLAMPHGERSAQAIRDDITSELEDVRFRITRLPDDIYQAIAPHGAIYQVIDQGFTPAQAQAVAWRVFTSQGITGFTDKSGRDWSLSAYVEMAVRTAATRAYNASHLARMHALGVSYFSVPDTGHPCPLCFPWQSRILTDGVIADPEIHVDATIAQATAAGLWHPNCRHALIPVFPGITVLPEPQEWSEEMANAYKLTQKQRALEREVRRAKRVLEYALDPDTRKKATADLRAAQARVREFVKANNLPRQSRREQTNLTDAYAKLPAPIR